MAEVFPFTVDKLLQTEDKLIGDERIKSIMLNRKTQGKNPNPDKYFECELHFAEVQNSVLQSVLRHVQKFDFDEDVANEASDPILGPFLVAEEESLYIGQFKGDIREGRGIQIFKDGCYYEGYFKDDNTHVKGRLIFGDGDMYLGQLTGNAMNGRGVYIKKSGSKYTGMFVDDAPEGKGREEWEDGSQFQGNYLNGAKHGYGVFKFENKTLYKGNFKNDVFWGEGSLTMQNGTEYKGDWIQGTLQSPASIVSANGNVYKGEIKNMKGHGMGEYNDHGRVFMGNFVEGKLEGEITVKNLDGSTQKALYKDGNFQEWLSKPPKKSSSELNGLKNGREKIREKRPAKKKKKGCLCC